MNTIELSHHKKEGVSGGVTPGTWVRISPNIEINSYHLHSPKEIFTGKHVRDSHPSYLGMNHVLLLISETIMSRK